MPNLVAELNSLDFSVYIGGPLQAAIQAQHAASMSQVEFINSVGFELSDPADPDSTKLIRYVDFEYSKLLPNPDFDSAETEDPDTNPRYTNENIKVKVPFLTMLNIPSLSIEEISIDFNAKLSSVETSSLNTEFAASAELGINYKIINFKATASYKRSTSSNVEVSKTYNIGVKVIAKQSELAPGLDRILTLLEDSIISTVEKQP